MKACTALLTSVGNLISPSQIDSLKNNPGHRKVKLIGTDMIEHAVGKYMVEEFYKVPGGEDSEYINTILDICRKENVDVILPVSNEEALALSKHRDLFEDIGAVIATSEYKTLELALNKGKAYSFLKEQGLACPKFYIAKSLKDFISSVYKLGFPETRVMMKPSTGRGGRGARILTNENLISHLLHEKPGSLYADFQSVVKTLEGVDEDNFPELIVMEYLPGKIHSVDFLAKNGEALIIVPKTRIIGNPSQTLVGQVEKDEFIEEDIRKISKAFNFEYNINIEMKRSRDGIALPFDINPRIAASVGFCTGAGANLIYYALKLALGENIPSNVVVQDGTKMVRYLKELYVK